MRGDDPQQLVWPNHCSHTSGKCFPFVLCSIIYALPAGFHPVTWQANVHKGVPVTIAQMLWQGRRAKHGSHNNQPAPLLFSHLTFIHHPSFLLSLPDSALIEIYYPNEPPALVSDRPYVMFTRDGHANHSRLQTARYIADEYASSRLLVVVSRMMRKTIDWWGACGRSVCVWVSPSLDFHRCYLFSFLPDQPHLPIPRFSIDNISYTFSIPGHMALFFLQAGYA